MILATYASPHNQMEEEKKYLVDFCGLIESIYKELICDM